MTLNDYAYRIWNLVKPRLTDDENIDLRDFKDWIVSQRALVLRNEFNKGRTIDDSLIQSLGCVELVVAGTSECPCFPGCTMLRTKLEIPTAIQMHNTSAITRIGFVDLQRKGFPIIRNLEELAVVGNSRFNKKQIYATIIGNYVYLKLSNAIPWQSAMKYINIRGVWEDPREVSEFKSYPSGECGSGEGTSCYNDATTPFPINQWFIDYIEGAIQQYKIPQALGAHTDPVNDGEAIETLVQNLQQREAKKQG